MIEGGKVICTRSDLEEFQGMKLFTKGKEYEIQGLGDIGDGTEGIMLRTDGGDLTPPLVLDGNFWTFEVVK